MNQNTEYNNNFEQTPFFWGYLLEKALGVPHQQIIDRNVTGEYVEITYMSMLHFGEHDDSTERPCTITITADFLDNKIISVATFPDETSLVVDIPKAVLEQFDEIIGNTPTF